jgi:hypothetical protein
MVTERLLCAHGVGTSSPGSPTSLKMSVPRLRRAREYESSVRQNLTSSTGCPKATGQLRALPPAAGNLDARQCPKSTFYTLMWVGAPDALGQPRLTHRPWSGFPVPLCEK